MISARGRGDSALDMRMSVLEIYVANVQEGVRHGVDELMGSRLHKVLRQGNLRSLLRWK